MNTAWLRAQDRRRSLLAWLSTLSLYAFALGAAWLVGLAFPSQLALTPGPIIVDLGGAEGQGGLVPQGLESAPDRPADAPPGAAPAPASGAETLPQPETAPPPTPATASAAALPAPAMSAAKPAPKPAPKPATKPTVPKNPSKATIPDASAKAQAENDAQAQLAAEQDRIRAAEAAALQPSQPGSGAPSATPQTKTFGAPVTSSGAGSAPGVVGGTGSVTFKGAEMGNALATTFGASTGEVGRNLYVPIYMYMPLPLKLDDSIYSKLQGKQTFSKFYQQSGSSWTLIAQPQVADRGDFWAALEAAGFDASTADYKTSRKLSPVVLEFAVGPVQKGKVELVQVNLVSSSGSPEVDEAVIYGFKRASFFNKTGNAIAGKFVYGF